MSRPKLLETHRERACRMSPVSQGNTTPGGPLNVPGVPIPTSPVVYRNPSARERAEKEDKR